MSGGWPACVGCCWLGAEETEVVAFSVSPTQCPPPKPLSPCLAHSVAAAAAAAAG